MGTLGLDSKVFAILNHVVSQTQQNIDFLVSQNFISPSDASIIVSNLKPLSDQSIPQIETPALSGPRKLDFALPNSNPSPLKAPVRVHEDSKNGSSKASHPHCDVPKS